MAPLTDTQGRFKAELFNKWDNLVGILEDEDVETLWGARYRNIASIEGESRQNLENINVCAPVLAILKPITGQGSQPSSSRDAEDSQKIMKVELTQECIDSLSSGVASIMLKNFLEPNVLIAVHDQWEKFANPIKTNASGATSTQVDHVLERLKVELHKLKELPCCMDTAHHTVRPIPSYTWRYGEASATEVEKSRKWLQDNVAPPGVKVVAVTSPDLLHAKWAEHRIELTASKTDFLFIPDTVAEALPSPPTHPSTTQLEDIITKVLAVYDTKTSSKVAEKGISHLRPQLIVQILLLRRARELAGLPADQVPAFGGDCNQHLIVHYAQDMLGQTVLHAAKEPIKVDKSNETECHSVAVFCMQKLVKAQLELQGNRGAEQTAESHPSPNDRPKKKPRPDDDGDSDHGGPNSKHDKGGPSVATGSHGKTGNFGASLAYHTALDMVAMMEENGSELLGFDSVPSFPCHLEGSADFEIVAL